MRSSLLAALAVLSVSAALGAQPQLLGLTQATPLVVQQDTATCAMQKCAPLGFPPVGNPLWGGAAYDNAAGGVWISDGYRIALVDVNSCAYLCVPQPMPNTTAGNEVTGLAYSELLGRLFVTDMSGIIRWYKVSNCQISLDARCIAPINPGDTLTGCATDDINGLIYYSAVNPANPGGVVYIAKQTSPCQPFCKLQIQKCGGNPLNLLTGLAFDACRQVLWATDGKLTVGVVVSTSACNFNEVQCCVNSSGEPLQGLCLYPGQGQSLGNSCTKAPCPACPTLAHVLGGTPVVGGSFSLDLINAPAQSQAVLVLNVGPCMPPGVSIGILCGPIYVPLAPPPLVLGPLPTNGTVGCTGGVSVSVTVGNNPAFCGAVLSSQYVGICPITGAIGTFVSNCLTWQVGTP